MKMAKSKYNYVILCDGNSDDKLQWNLASWWSRWESWMKMVKDEYKYVVLCDGNNDDELQLNWHHHEHHQHHE